MIEQAKQFGRDRTPRAQFPVRGYQMPGREPFLMRHALKDAVSLVALDRHRAEPVSRVLSQDLRH
jgi:hypothetical protein